MDLHIRANGTKVTAGMREFIERRMTRLDKIASNVIDAQLELRTVASRTGAELTTAQLTLKTGRHILRAEVRDPEPAKAIDAAIDKLLGQARRYSDKRTSGRRRSTNGYAPVAPALPEPTTPVPAPATMQAVLESSDDDRDELDEQRVVRIKRFPMKPMQVDEAIDQLELVGHDFFLFLNADENQLNVIYRRRDGDYGLLLPS